MENEEKMMTGEESLRIITEMINKTKGDIRQASFHLLFWGWLLIACSLSEYLLYKFTNFPTPWYVWFLVIPGVLVSMIYGYLTSRRLRFYSYASKVYMWTWFSFFFAAVALFIITARNIESFPPIILVLAGIPTFISGIIIKFRPLVLGGIIFWIMALIAHFAKGDITYLAMPFALLTGYIIPGHLLRRKSVNNEIQRA